LGLLFSERCNYKYRAKSTSKENAQIKSLIGKSVGETAGQLWQGSDIGLIIHINFTILINSLYFTSPTIYRFCGSMGLGFPLLSRGNANACDLIQLTGTAFFNNPLNNHGHNHRRTLGPLFIHRMIFQ